MCILFPVVVDTCPLPLLHHLLSHHHPASLPPFPLTCLKAHGLEHTVFHVFPHGFLSPPSPIALGRLVSNQSVQRYNTYAWGVSGAVVWAQKIGWSNHMRGRKKRKKTYCLIPSILSDLFFSELGACVDLGAR